MSEIDSQQWRTRRWVWRTFGTAKADDKCERGLRLVEEAAEFAQAVGVESAALSRVIARVYSRPVGEVSQELAGTAVCLLAAATACDVRLSNALDNELFRLETTDPEYFRNKNRDKQKDGVSVAHEMPTGVPAWVHSCETEE